jgi:hypothetical protein
LLLFCVYAHVSVSGSAFSVFAGRQCEEHVGSPPKSSTY